MAGLVEKPRCTMQVQLSEKSVLLTLSGELVHIWRKSARQALKEGQSECQVKETVFTKLQTLLRGKDFRFRTEFASCVAERLWKGLFKESSSCSALHLSVPKYEFDLPTDSGPVGGMESDFNLERYVDQALEEVGLKDICQR